jgi:hypothetical protein
MDFAAACLEVFAQDSDPCQSVKYLRDNDLISSRDLQTLEDYYLSAGKRRSEALSKIKQIYSCF